MTKLFDITPRKKTILTSQTANMHSSSGMVFMIVAIVAVLIFTISMVQNSNIKTASNNDSKSPIDNQQSQNQTDQYVTTHSDQPIDYNNEDLTFSIESPIDTNNDLQANQNSSLGNDSVEIDKSQIKIRILNGSGRSGVASQTKKTLEKDGFTISSIGTARNIYSKTVIYYNQGKEAESRLVAGFLPNENVKFEENSQLTGEPDLLIVVGRD